MQDEIVFAEFRYIYYDQDFIHEIRVNVTLSIRVDNQEVLGQFNRFHAVAFYGRCNGLVLYFYRSIQIFSSLRIILFPNNECIFSENKLHLNMENTSRKAIMMIRQNRCTLDISVLSVGHDLIRASFNGLSFAWLRKDNK